ncbi:MAG TPA: hypothetical protein VM364_12140 [Vicinamibacterales bacterium]|nr:hypothetical protein [Vicinamibacterales bacterium]
MKKLAIGCGVIILLLGIGLAGLGYYVYRQVSPAIAQFAELAKVPELERDIRNRDPFVPPSSEELTDAQIEKLVKVQSDVRSRIGASMAVFEQKYRELAEKQQASVQDVSSILQAYADLTKTWIEAKRAQVEALNATGLSLDEYRWIREQAYRALGQPFVDLDVSRLVEQARSGAASSDALGQLKGALEPLGPEANRQRIEKIRKLLEENLALASFGL